MARASLSTCRVVADPADLKKVADNLQSSDKLNEAIRRAPWLGRLVRLINPAGDLSTPLKRATIAHAALTEDRLTAVTAAMAHVANVDPEKLFTIDKDTRMMSLETRRGRPIKVAENDFYETPNPGKKFKLTPEQTAIHEYMNNLWQNLVDDFHAHGGSGLPAEELKFPRMVAGRLDNNGKLRTKLANTRGSGGIFGSRGSYNRGRAAEVTWEVQYPDGSPADVFVGDLNAAKLARGAWNRANKGGGAKIVKASEREFTQEEMIGQGWRYRPAVEALNTKARELGQRTADAQYMSWLKTQPYIRTKRQLLGGSTNTGVYPVQPADKFGGPQGLDIDVRAFASSRTPGLTGYYAPAEVTNYVEDILGRPSKIDIPVITRVSQETRGFKASFDLGSGGLQLLGALANDLGNVTRGRPTHTFLTALHGMVKTAFVDPEYLTKYFEANKDLIDRWSTHLGGLNNSELYSGIDQSIGARIPVVGTLYKRSGKAFESSLDIAKIETAKAFETIFAKELAADPDATREALGAWLRDSTGVLSSARLGIGPFQRQVEADFGFFSPRYVRSTFAMAGAIFKNDIGGDQARRALAAFALAGAAVYAGAALATGQEPQYDVRKPGFLSLRVGDNYIGIGGGMRALARLVEDSYFAAKDHPENFISTDFSGPHRNPILSFWRGRSAPIVSSAIDIFTGQDFKGRPVQLDGVDDWGRILMDKLMPFSPQAAFEARGQVYTRAGLGVAAGLGFNTNPMSARDVYDKYLRSIRDAHGEQRFPAGVDTVNTKDNHFEAFRTTDPTAKTLLEAYQQSRRENGGISGDIQKLIDDRTRRVKLADQKLLATADYRQYRSDINAIRANSREAFKVLSLDSAPTTADKTTVNSWYAIYDNPTAIDPVTGGINSDGLDQLQAQWKSQHPGEWERLIEPNEEIGATPLEAQLRKDRAAISNAGWWDTGDVAWASLQQLAAAHHTKIDLSKYVDEKSYIIGQRAAYTKRAADRGLKFPALAADIAMARDPVVQAFSKIRTYERLKLEKAHPEIIPLLSKWGYSAANASEYGLAAANLPASAGAGDLTV